MAEKTIVQRVAGILGLWFGFRRRVGRRAYALTGFGLALFKYLADASIVWNLAGRVWTPMDYLSPFWTSKLDVVESGFAIWVLAIWTIPFLWIGASMTARRAVDAGASPLVVLLFFVPAINYILMVLLCFFKPSDRQQRRAEDHAARTLLNADIVGAVVASAVLSLALLLVAVTYSEIGTYAYGLFLGGPFAMGFVSAYIFDRRQDHGLLTSAGVVQLGLAVAAGCLLFFGLEGAFCLVMAYPLAGMIAFVGGVLGRSMAGSGRAAASPFLTALLLAPTLTVLDRDLPLPPVREVVTAIEIDAPPEQIWPYLVSFTELPPPSRLLFKTGIAHPIRARIEGHGVGAIRYCEFSTGPFVEPITHWEEPVRLSFDVVAEPPTMHEWSPYKDLRPPHLEGTFRSRRGEFRLIELADGRTRLEGSTWYQLDMYPHLYWRLWSDGLIHSIHSRVLEHVKRLSEAPPETRSAS